LSRGRRLVSDLANRDRAGRTPIIEQAKQTARPDTQQLHNRIRIALDLDHIIRFRQPYRMCALVTHPIGLEIDQRPRVTLSKQQVNSPQHYPIIDRRGERQFMKALA
jgi:hypothetical protein